MKNIDNIHDNRVAGIISISLLAVAFLIGTYSILKYNALAASIYFIAVLTGFFLNVYFFCRKCPHIADNSCRFVVWGKVACLFPKNRIGERYSYFNRITIWVTRLFMFLFPRPWLFKSKILFIIFVICILSALLIWVTSMCQTCRNEKCRFRKMAITQK